MPISYRQNRGPLAYLHLARRIYLSRMGTLLLDIGRFEESLEQIIFYTFCVICDNWVDVYRVTEDLFQKDSRGNFRESKSIKILYNNNLGFSVLASLS